MAQWQVTISGKGIRKDSVDKLAQKLKDQFGEGATIHTKDATPPSTRAERFQAALDLVSDAKSEAESLRDELQEWKDGLPENLQDGDKAGQLDEAVSNLEDLIGVLEDAESKEVEFPSMMG